MSANVRSGIKRYLESRRLSGVEVVYRLEAGSRDGAPAAPEMPPGGVSLVTSPVTERPAERAGGGAAPVSGGVRREATSAAPRRTEESASIRVSPPHGSASQSSLFDEPRAADAPDLGAYDLPGLERLVSECRRCGLCAGRTRTVFGSGSPTSRIIFIGEAPGREEDLQGLPFVGRAGQLLTKILAAMGFTRDEVYITNILKCRPPNNRDPQEDEMTACEPYLARQLELIRPVIICALGRIAGHGLLKKGTSLSFLRRAVHYYGDIPVAVTYHPAALLRNPNLKHDAWEDFQMVRRLYDERIREDG